MFSEKHAKEASAKGLNRTAKGAELFAKKNVKQKMTTRNKWTVGSIKSTRTPLGRPIKKQFVLVGSLQPYLADQEDGAKLSRTKVGRRITTARGSREGRTAYPRKKVARGGNRSKSIKLKKQRRVLRAKTRGVQAKINVERARKAGRKFVYLNLGQDKKGIFRVNKKSIVMIHRIMDRQLTVRPRKWFEPAVDKARKAAPSAFRLELQKAITTSGIFR